MKNFKENLNAYADHLEENNCEFFIAVHDVTKNDTRVIYSDNAVAILSAIFEKSNDIYGLFKRAERLMDLQQPLISLN